jgi:hypothetical protein
MTESTQYNPAGHILAKRVIADSLRRQGRDTAQARRNERALRDRHPDEGFSPSDVARAIDRRTIFMTRLGANLEGWTRDTLGFSVRDRTSPCRGDRVRYMGLDDGDIDDDGSAIVGPDWGFDLPIDERRFTQHFSYAEFSVPADWTRLTRFEGRDGVSAQLTYWADRKSVPPQAAQEYFRSRNPRFSPLLACDRVVPYGPTPFTTRYGFYRDAAPRTPSARLCAWDRGGDSETVFRPVMNMRAVARALERVRSRLGNRPLYITPNGGIRDPRFAGSGTAPFSFHFLGLAADVRPSPGISIDVLARALRREFLYVHEYGSFVHADSPSGGGG